MMLANLLFAATASGPTPVIEIPDRPVDASDPSLVHVEPHRAINPSDPDHWVAGAIVTAPDQKSDWRCAALASFDAGGSWVRQDLDIDRCIDPWVVVFADGHAVLTATEIQEGHEGDQRFVLLRFYSEDGGRSWSGPRMLGRTFEHAMAVPGETGLDGERRSAELRVSTQSSCPNAPGNGRAGARSWNSGGDHSSIAALPGDRYALIWADSRSGRLQLRSAVVRVESTPPKEPAKSGN